MIAGRGDRGGGERGRLWEAIAGRGRIGGPAGGRLNVRSRCTKNRGRTRKEVFYSRNVDHRLEGHAKAERIEKLPALASTFHAMERYEWGPTLKTILIGVHDPNACSLLSCLRGKEDTLVEHIFSFVTAKWAKHVTLTLPAFAVGSDTIPRGHRFMRFKRDPEQISIDRFSREELLRDSESGQELLGLVSYASLGVIEEFPEPADRKINMLPFIFGDIDSLPDDLKCYHTLIEQCPYMEDEIGKVGYLTVHESYIDASKAQRRKGIHIETPGVSFGDGGQSGFTPGEEHAWGMGMFYAPDRLEGGIFMASTVEDSSEVWDALVDKNIEGIVDRHGGCEHLRGLLGPGKKLKANELIWMTDCTPHEALPQKQSGYRQFFRVVTSQISHWFADHSTPNPLVPLPANVVLVRGSKFEV